MACRLIPLDKNPGLRPIGIGETLRRIIGKAVMNVLKLHIKSSVGNMQLCAGHAGGCEVGVHAVVDMFNGEDTEGVIQVDASNAFNSINRKILLHNAKVICPEFATYIYNSYCVQARMFIVGGKEIKSKEGTTQGDPIAMASYGIGLTPLLDRLLNSKSEEDEWKQSAFADDISAIGKLLSLRKWWDLINEYGPYIGYFPKSSKSWLTVKEEFLQLAKESFYGTGINITIYGRKHLGAVIGCKEFKDEFIGKKVDDWIKEIENLSNIAKTEPHAAYSCFIKGECHKFNYIMSTVPDISEQLLPLDEAIDKFISALFNSYDFNTLERKLWSLPVRKGGMGLIIPSKISDNEYKNSRLLNESLIEKVCEQDSIYEDQEEKLKRLKVKVKKEKEAKYEAEMEHIKQSLSSKEKLRALESCLEKGASNWLNTLPLKMQGFALDKQTFWDAIYVRYNIPLSRLPSKCVYVVTLLR